MNATVVRDVMTPDPLTVESDRPITEAAKVMRDRDIGPVIVVEDGKLSGILTDRDIIVRGIAEGRALDKIKVRDVCSSDPTCVSPDTPIEEAVSLMRDQAIRRLPVVEGDRPVGIVSIGDLAVERDPSSALADISKAPANN